MTLMLKPNPGGELGPEEIIGRDGLVRQLLRVLERQSVVLTAERRIGKTKTLAKLQAEAPDALRMFYHDLEPVHTAADFAESVFQDVKSCLGAGTRTAEWTRRLLQNISGANIGEAGVTLAVTASPWKKLLMGSLAELAAQHAERVVFLWDELPLMLDNIANKEGEQTAMEVLDTLRALRQTYPALRMVYTGSIGLHHVLTRLKRAGYANDPTNDMYILEVPPLAVRDAELLARALLLGGEVETPHLYPVARAMAAAVDDIPYYIHYLASEMELADTAFDVPDVERLVARMLTDERDRWHLHHYEERVATYYREEDQPFILALIDLFAVADGPLSFAEAFNLLKARVVTEDTERVRKLLGLLCQDHYLRQETDGAYCFRYDIVRRWWRLHRGVEESA